MDCAPHRAGRDAGVPHSLPALLRRVPLVTWRSRRSRSYTHDDMRALVTDELVSAHRARALNPERPTIKGTSQNPDVYFAGRETVNKYYAAVPGIVQKAMDKLAKLTGRAYKLFDYVGAPDAERVIVMMGNGAEAAEEAAEYLVAKGEGRRSQGAPVPPLQPRAFRTGPAEIRQGHRGPGPHERARRFGEPLYEDVRTAIGEAMNTGFSRRRITRLSSAAATAWAPTSSPAQSPRAFSTSSPRRRRRTTSPSASTTT